MYNFLINGIVTISKPVITKIAVGIGSGVVATVIGKKVYNNVKKEYDSDGFDQNGYNKEGYDRYGYNKKGYNKEGYNKEGFDQRGYDRFGFDKTGYNIQGYDKDGYNRDGFDCYGYDKDGYARNGFNRYGFDRYGKNKAHRDQKDIYKEIDNCNKQVSKIWKNFKNQDFLYALTDCRQIMERTSRNLIEHSYGDTSYRDKKLIDCLRKVKSLDIISEEMINKVHKARIICNDVIHDNRKVETNSVYFVIKTTEELLDIYKWETGF